MPPWLNGREFEWTPGVGDGQGGLACCDSWGPQESETTERLNWTELNWWLHSGKKSFQYLIIWPPWWKLTSKLLIVQFTMVSVLLIKRIMHVYYMKSAHPWLYQAQIKNLPAVQETLVQYLGKEDFLEKGMTTLSNIPAWRIPWTEQPGGLQSMGLQRVEHDWTTNTLTLLSMHTKNNIIPWTPCRTNEGLKGLTKGYN